MKKLSIIVIVLYAYAWSASGQSISPLESTEVCPNTNITFTVTLPATINDNIYISSVLNGPIVVSGPTDITHTPSQTTLKFVGKFQDVNNKQTFKVNYVTSSNPNASKEFPFKNIKSLFFPLTPSTSCSIIQLGQSSVTVPLCQVVDIPISFSNIKWSTYGESPAYCFGTITAYDYQLPNGWKIGATVSNGTNWIPGNNSVTVTSDLTTGNNGYIRVRPRNDCSAGLASGDGSDIVQLAIFRPGPTLTITGPGDNICAGGANFTVNGMPAGSTVQWTVSNTSAASLSCATCATVAVNRIGSSNANATLTATVTYCGLVYTKTRDISIGSPTTTGMFFQIIDPTFGKIRAVATAVPGATSYNWYINGTMGTLGGHGIGYTFGGLSNCDVYYDISVAAVTACGTSAQYHQNVYMPCEDNFMMSPNPASGNVTVSADQSKSVKQGNTAFDEVRIYDMQGNLKKYQKFNKVKSASVDVSNLPTGTYFIEIISGTYKERKPLIIQK